MASESLALPNVLTPALKDQHLKMSYRIGRGEQGVLTFQPYKSYLLPHWRFATPPAARKSSQTLHAYFKAYEKEEDFVGMDMTRKFIQMGVTRARRYANYKGGRKYDKQTGAQNEKGKEFAGRAEKLESSEIFRKILDQVNASDVYHTCRKAFIAEKSEWDKNSKT